MRKKRQILTILTEEGKRTDLIKYHIESLQTYQSFRKNTHTERERQKSSGDNFKSFLNWTKKMKCIFRTYLI